MTGLHGSRCTQKCTLIFAFRSCYCLGSFVLQDLFQVYKYLLSTYCHFHFVVISNHYITNNCAFLSLQLTTHTSIKAAKIVKLKPFPSSTNFDPDLRLPRINCMLFNLLSQITLESTTTTTTITTTIIYLHFL